MLLQALFFASLCWTFVSAEEKITAHTLPSNRGALDYTAIVRTGEIGWIAYIKQTGENRPITFAFNGGPGASSAWLHIGAMGPRRVLSPEEGQSTTPPYKMTDNQETLLDLTDLVFIDPPGTGFSKPNPDCYNVKADIQAVGNFIRSFLTEHERWNSPKYIAGESYGALRSAGLADYLQSEYGIYLNGLILISPALDLQTLIFHPDNPLPYLLYLPTYAATAWYHGLYLPDAPLEEAIQKARKFAYETYPAALLSPSLCAQRDVYETLSQVTGLPIETIEKNRGKIPEEMFQLQLLSQERKVIGRFDSRIAGYDEGEDIDPSACLIDGIFSAALHDYLHKELQFRQSYILFSSSINEKWNYRTRTEWGYPNLMGAVRRALIANPSMKIFVGCGYFDLATPFATAEYSFEHLNIPDAFIHMKYYEAGHMFYLHPPARIKFKQDLINFYNPTAQFP